MSPNGGSHLVEAENERLKDQLAVAREGLDAVQELINNSQGVYGLHLNGDPAPWDSLLTGGYFESWLLKFDEAREALAQMEARDE